MKMSGARIITALLEQQGVRIIPGIPGGANLPMYDALRDSNITHVLARHEQGAGFIAHGMARATGETAVFFATSGPGATNALTAIADARLDSVPLVCITGQVPQAMIGTDAFQEIDTYGLTVPITKHNFMVRSAGELLQVIPEAFRIASSGRPGPVVVDVPKDVQNAVIEVDELPAPARPDASPALNMDDLREAAEIIRSAKRPVILFGAGVIISGASPGILMLMEQCEIPAACTLHGLGGVPHDHPLFMGMVGMHAARCTNMLLEECDLLIAMGMRFDDRATGKAAEFCPSARIIHIDIDPAEIGKIKSPILGIEADLAEAVSALVSCLDTIERTEWIGRMNTLKEYYPLVTPGVEDPLEPYGIIAQTASLLDDDAIVTSDVGQHQMWTAQAFPFRYPRQWLTSGGLGTMGFGLPAAIGAALACPTKTVVCFSGDGSLLMNIQELDTAAELGVNVKIVLLNNAHLGLVKQQQELFYGERYHASKFHHEPDFAAIARGFGVAAYDLGAEIDPLETLARALQQTGPCLINVPIHPGHNVYPMVPPGGANHEMIEGASYASQGA